MRFLLYLAFLKKLVPLAILSHPDYDLLLFQTGPWSSKMDRNLERILVIVSLSLQFQAPSA